MKKKIIENAESLEAVTHTHTHTHTICLPNWWTGLEGELHFSKIRKEKGITLVALVIMIVILLILAGITIATLGGENGLFARAKQAKEETQKETATEQVNLVISDVYVKSYTEKQEEPTLQDIADGFCNAEGTEYVDIKTKNVSALTTVDVTGYTAIYVKLKKYPYEFKIDDTLKIASIDGVEVSSTTGSTNNGDTSSGETDTSGSTSNSGNSNFADSEEYQTMSATITQMQTTMTQMQSKITELEEQQSDSIKGSVTRTDLISSEVTLTKGTIIGLSDSIDNYDYIEFVGKEYWKNSTTGIISYGVQEVFYDSSTFSLNFDDNKNLQADFFIGTINVTLQQYVNSSSLYVGYVNLGGAYSFALSRIIGIKL